GGVRRAGSDLGPHPHVVELVQVEMRHLGQLEAAELRQDPLGLPDVTRDVGLALLALDRGDAELLGQDVVDDLALHELGHHPATTRFAPPPSTPPTVVAPPAPSYTPPRAGAPGPCPSENTCGRAAQQNKGAPRCSVRVRDNEVRAGGGGGPPGGPPRHEQKA